MIGATATKDRYEYLRVLCNAPRRFCPGFYASSLLPKAGDLREIGGILLSFSRWEI